MVLRPSGDDEKPLWEGRWWAIIQIVAIAFLGYLAVNALDSKETAGRVMVEHKYMEDRINRLESFLFEYLRKSQSDPSFRESDAKALEKSLEDQIHALENRMNQLENNSRNRLRSQ